LRNIGNRVGQRDQERLSSIPLFLPQAIKYKG